VRKRKTFHNADEGSGFSGGAEQHSDRRLLILGVNGLFGRERVALERFG
jgi:hypothetical protein